MLTKERIVNFLDLNSQYQSIKEEISEAIAAVFEATSFAGGPFVAEFEEQFARAHQAKFCAAVNNGTSALHAVLMALGIKHGDEIIVPANTFFATPEAVSLSGATPVFVDCDERYYNIDPQKIEAAITKHTKAVFAVHLYGQPAPLGQIKEITDKYNLVLLEDSAQAHMATLNGVFTGNIGLAGSFSFYPGKNLGAYGEAGAILTNNEELYTQLQKIKDHGSSKKYYHDTIGHNYRMAAIQAAILSVKLKYLKSWTDRRRMCAEMYGHYLRSIREIKLPQIMEGAEHSFHLYVIKSKKREELMTFLKEKGVYTGIHYPIPCHLQKAYKDLGHQPGSFPVTEVVSKEILSLPMSDQLTEEDIKYVAELLKQFYVGVGV